jgi:hypothetical protein
MSPSLIKDLYLRAATFARSQVAGDPKAKRIASAKRKYELELRARGVSRSQAKIAVAVRFNGGKL